MSKSTRPAEVDLEKASAVLETELMQKKINGQLVTYRRLESLMLAAGTTRRQTVQLLKELGARPSRRRGQDLWTLTPPSDDNVRRVQPSARPSRGEAAEGLETEPAAGPGAASALPTWQQTTHPLTLLSNTDPARILQLRDRQYSAELIAAALLHFDCFSWLKAHDGAGTEALCRHFGWQPRPADVLLTLCRAYGFLTTDPEGGHHLTLTAAEHLVQESPSFLGPYYAPIRDTPIVQTFLQVLTTGHPGGWQAGSGAADWHASMLDPAFADSFTALMNCRGRTFGQHLAQALTPHLAGRRHVLDVGGGSGIYAAALVAAHPGLTATVLEQPPVDAITRREIAGHGLADRVAVHSADMFAGPWPETDVLLLSNVLHDWDVPEVRLLLEKAAAALPPGGLLVIHGAFIADDKTGPIPVAEYSALLMNITQGKCYSAAEYAALLQPLGFRCGSFQATVADRGFMTAVKS